MKISINHGSDQVLAAFNDLTQRASNPRPALLLIGEELTASTKERFQKTEDPDGNQWVENAALTKALKGDDTPLTGNTRNLQNGIAYQLSDETVEVGSEEIYAAIQHFGGTITPKNGGSLAVPNGDGGVLLLGSVTIPARPFLGVSDEDEREIVDIIREYLIGS